MSNTNTDTKTRLESWKVQSSEEPGFHKVITPDTAECQEAQIFRLNLPAGQSYTLESGDLELHPVLIAGKAKLSDHESLDQEMEKFDSFYIPGQDKVTITALEDSIFYIAGAKYEGIGQPMFRKFDATLPVGDIHQIHGSGSGQREVMMTLAPGDEASRLICGLTWSGDGTWTSWPPHQHEKDLEEVYCYFDMPLPRFGFHISYLKSGGSGGSGGAHSAFRHDGAGPLRLPPHSSGTRRTQCLSVGAGVLQSGPEKLRPGHHGSGFRSGKTGWLTRHIYNQITYI